MVMSLFLPGRMPRLYTIAKLYGEVVKYCGNLSVIGMLGSYEPLLLHK